MRKLLLVLLIAVLTQLPASAYGIAWARSHYWLWYNDTGTNLVTGTIRIYEAPYMCIGTSDSRLFVSFEPNQRVTNYVTGLPPGSTHPTGWIPFYIRNEGAFTGSDDGVTVLFTSAACGAPDFEGGCASFNSAVHVVGQLTQQQVGPFVGTAAGVSEPQYSDYSRFAFGVFNMGLQMTAGHWIGSGGIREAAYYHPEFWATDAKILIAEISQEHFAQDKNLIYAAATAGKIVILPGAAFQAVVDESGEQIQELVYDALTFQYIELGAGGIINGSTTNETRWDFDWAAGGGYPYAYPVWNYVTLAQGFNQVCMLLSNSAPVADAGSDRRVSCSGTVGTPVQLDGSGSHDPDGDALTYRWTGPFPEGNGRVSGQNPVVTLPLGTWPVTLVVSDGQLDSPEATVNITVAVTVEGFLSPLSALAAEGQQVQFPDKALRLGRTLPMKLELSCGGTTCLQGLSAPRIAGLVWSGEALDLEALDLDAGSANDGGLSFRLEDCAWTYRLSTKALAAGSYVITIEMPDGVRYNGGFVLR